MISEVLKYISVYAMSMLKFIAGPTMGAALGLSFSETLALTILGMMTTVALVSFYDQPIRKLYVSLFVRRKKKFTKANRRFLVFWRKYGIFGVSFLTPVLFSPILGALLVNALGSPRKKIFLYMLFSAVFWGIALTKTLHFILQIIA